MALRRVVHAGWIGQPTHLSLECRQQIRRTTIDGWRENMAEPYLSDFAIHHFDLIRWIAGVEPLEVTGLSFRPPWSWFKGPTAAAAIVTDSAGQHVEQGAAQVDPKNRRLLVVALTALSPAVYKVLWRVLAVDGHRTQGDFRFTLKPAE